MAQYEHLQIYKSTYEFLIYYSQILANYRRECKYTIGEKLFNNIIELLIQIYKINSVRDKLERLNRIDKLFDYIVAGGRRITIGYRTRSRCDGFARKAHHR